MFDQPFKNPRLQTSQHNFARAPQADIPRSSFNRSHSHKTTFNAGDIIPFFVDEALPGDTFNLRATTFARFATPKVPIMDNLYCDIFYFAVPNRILWENWERFNGAQDNPGDSTDYATPTITIPAVTGVQSLELLDYMGLQVGVPSIPNISALFVRAYNKTYNDWFRDENLQDSVDLPTDDGPDPYSTATIQRSAKRHDYFTSALPFPQKGPAILLPLGSTAPVLPTSQMSPPGAGSPNFNYAGQVGQSLKVLSGSPLVNTNTVPGANSIISWWDTNDPEAVGLFTDLAAAVGPDINEFRQAVQLQRLLERDARGGTRYVEILRSHFGVISPDFRLQRSEYLGGGTTPVVLSPIPQTSESATTPQGNLAAMGTFSHAGTGFVKSFVEHSIVLGLMRVRADLTYQQGVNRMWSRQTRYDYYWPVLSHLGEQAILNKEIFCDGSANDDDVFGYQERYAEYRYKPSMITGLFRSNVTAPQTSIDQWHLSQDFAGLPVLGPLFIQENPPIARVIAVSTEPHFLFDSAIRLTCARPMPVYSVPGLVDHF